MAEPDPPPRLRSLDVVPVRIDGREPWPDPSGTVAFASVAFEREAA